MQIVLFSARKWQWRVSICSPLMHKTLANTACSWGIFNSLLGWQNSATYGSVISYNMYWIAVIIGFIYLGWKESKSSPSNSTEIVSETSSEDRDIAKGDKTGTERAGVNSAVREI